MARVCSIFLKTRSGLAHFIGILVPTTRERCGLQSYVIFVLIWRGFGGRSRRKGRISLRRRRKLNSVSVRREDDGVLARPA
jgi:hypothetical protein